MSERAARRQLGRGLAALFGEAGEGALAGAGAGPQRLVPIERTGPDRRREAIERLKLFREGHTLDVPVKQLIGEGRR